jgi:hypothetical protein
MVILFFGLHFSKPKIADDNKKSKEHGNSYKWVVLFLIFSFLTDLSTRGTLYRIDAPQQFFVSLWFRAAYFSMFIIFFLYWWIQQKKEGIITKLKMQKKIMLALVTPLTFSLAFALKVPVVANNLAIGSVVSFVGNIIMLSLIGIFYKTDGTSPKWRERFCQVYIGERNVPSRFVYLTLYGILIITVIVWLCIRFFS